MKQSDITPKVIELSKEIAKHCQFPVGKGSWILPDKGFHWVEPLDKDKPHLVVGKTSPPNSYLDLEKYKGHNSLPYTVGYFIPIPSISNVLEKLRELKKQINIQVYDDGYILNDPKKSPQEILSISHFHEALLSALLEASKGESE